RIIRIRWSDMQRIDEVVAQVLVAIRQRGGH
ncbi:MAG: base excision DNA repair protein, partial [Actinomyces sp.]